tara:strand:- start:1334 stop:1741 length:408 start_codon:yes stop_codon:yes gene_type:complete
MKKSWQTFLKLFKKEESPEPPEEIIDESLEEGDVSEDEIAASLEFQVLRDGYTYVACSFGDGAEDIATFTELLNHVNTGILLQDTLKIILETCVEQERLSVYLLIVAALEAGENSAVVKPTDALNPNSDIFPNSL